MNTSRGNLAWLCIVWAFALLIGVTFSFNLPFVLLVGGTLLYLFS